LDNFIIEGRGGTNFSTAINAFSRKSAIKVIFTDGYAKMPEERKNVIWIVYGDDKINPLGGKVFYVDPDTINLKCRSK
jgi:predicted metal-dependent peptidase